MLLNEELRPVVRFVIGAAYVGTVLLSYLMVAVPTESATVAAEGSVSLRALFMVGSVFLGCIFAALSRRSWWWGFVTLVPLLGPFILFGYCRNTEYKSKYGGHVPPAK